MSLFSMLKTNSRLALRGNWGRAIAVLLIPVVISAVLSMCMQVPRQIAGQSLGVYYDYLLSGIKIPARYAVMNAVMSVLAVLVGFLVSPLSLGAARWFYMLVHGRSLPLREVFIFFESFNDYRRAVRLYVSIYFRSLLWSLLFLVLPGAISIFAAAAVTLNPGHTATTGLVFSFILVFLVVLLCTIFLNRYALAAYLLCESDDVRPGEAIRASIAYTKGYRFDLFLFYLSFIGWYFLCALTLGILLFYTAPYFMTANAMYCRYIAEKNRFVPPNDTKEFIV